MKTIIRITTALILTSLQFSCTKTFLEKKSNQALLVPTTLEDFRSLMDNNTVMNTTSNLLFLSVDDMDVLFTAVNGMDAVAKNSYLWQKDIYEGGIASDWNRFYQQVFYANIVLDGLEQYNNGSAGQAEFNQIKGSALFYRAHAFYNLLQQYAVVYHPDHLNKPGIPIRLSPDVNLLPARSSLQSSYKQVIDDLNEASGLLSTTITYKTRPSKQACYALLSRVYLSMADYPNAALTASNCLAINNQLIDYKTLNPTLARPVPRVLPNGNDEAIFFTMGASSSFFNSTSARVEVNFFKSYTASDLRKVILFNNRGNDVITFKGNYSGNSALYSGLTTDEVLLNRSESYARMGKSAEAMTDLNYLLRNRYDNTFVDRVVNDQETLLDLILTERRKELVYRGLRWTDIRRLNLEERYAKILTRVINGETFTLPVNDKRYVFPIPNNEIQQSGIAQNER